MDTLDELLEEELKDIYSAENQLTKALPKMAKKASSPTLKEAFTTHLEQTKVQIQRLDQVAESLGIKKLKGKVCKAMQGLIEEGNELFEEDSNSVLDAALIGAAQRIEHYEIAAYGTVKAIAQQMGNREVVGVLQQTLDEEGATDKLLTTISKNEVLKAAALEGQDDEDEEVEEDDE